MLASNIYTVNELNSVLHINLLVSFLNTKISSFKYYLNIFNNLLREYSMKLLEIIVKYSNILSNVL